MNTASDDRLTALALLYIAAVDRLCAALDAEGHTFVDDDLRDQVKLAGGALLEFLPPVVVTPCVGHETPRDGCPRCEASQWNTKIAAIGAALAERGLRDPWHDPPG